MIYITKKGYKNTPPHSNLLKISLLCLLMGIFTHIAFSQQPVNTLPDTGYVGVGTTNPSCTFHVVGASQISGNITVDSSITIADSARIDNNLRVNGHLFVGKNAYISDTTFTNTLRVSRITTLPGDSVIYFGDSTLAFSNYYHTIYPSGTGLMNIKGIGLGSGFSLAQGLNSLAIGYRTRTDENAPYSLCIGSGTASAFLYNTIPNSIMLGCNSNLPTLFISSANGANTIGKVGIGTTTPTVALDIRTIGNSAPSIKLSNDLGLHADILFYKNQDLYSLLRMGNDAHGATLTFEDRTKNLTDMYRFHISGKGIVYAREVEINIPAFPDYVFNPGYPLLNIKELEEYLIKHKHLPDMPPASEFDKKGSMPLGEITLKQMEKIEELFLYIIQLEKRITELENK